MKAHFSTGRRSVPAAAGSPLAVLLAENARAFFALAVVSGIINVLMLTGSIFMIQIYDRVLSSRSIPTLAALSAIAILAYLFQGSLDALRNRVLALIGERIDDTMGPDTYQAVAELPLRAGKFGQETLQPFRDLEAIRAFVSGPGLVAFLDMPWLPIYLVICYLFHPLLGYAAFFAAILLFSLAITTEIRGRAPVRRSLEAQSQRNLMADNTQRSAEVVRAMGMMPDLAKRWYEAHTRHMNAQREASYVTGGLSALAKMTRMLVQSCMLGLGAYLAVIGEISAGTIIAASILSARALAPVDLAITSWKGFIAARQGYTRLKEMLAAKNDGTLHVQLPPPAESLSAENLYVSAPGVAKPFVRNVSLKLAAGQALGIIGASASGKSTLARALVGIWTPLGGKVTLDGASIQQWDPAQLGPYIGYLPQDVQLFDGTVAENIARFQTPVNSQAVLWAARSAGFHDHILALPEGYETRIGRGGIELSAGQKQRLGLARALYGEPFLVVLDEPNSNLDAEGEVALSAAINGVKERKGIAVVIAHRPSVIGAVDFLAVMHHGEIAACGPRDEILAKTVQNASEIAKRTAGTADGFRVVSQGAGGAG